MQSRGKKLASRKSIMSRKFYSRSRSISGFIQPLIGFLLVAIFAVSLIALFASRAQNSPQTASQPQQSASQILSPTTTTTTSAVSQTEPTAGWKVYSLSKYGLLIDYPPDF